MLSEFDKTKTRKSHLCFTFILGLALVTAPPGIKYNTSYHPCFTDEKAEAEKSKGSRS